MKNTLSAPKIALVGRPNVGKSALFNRLCGQRISIVDEEEGVTRDRLYAEIEFLSKKISLIDTGGIDNRSIQPLNAQVKKQAELAIEEADVVIFVVDAQVGLTVLDEEVARILLQHKKSVVLAINKIDQLRDGYLVHQFHSLGLKNLIAISAMQGYQVFELLEMALLLISKEREQASEEEEFEEQRESEECLENAPVPSENLIRVAIAGRTNVGKSTLLNAMLTEQRVIVSDMAGTTRDSIDVPFQFNDQNYLFIDTAGIRRKKSERDVIEKFAALRTTEALERSDVVLLVLDSQEGLTGQEKRIASEIEALGKSCILLFNKWDLIEGVQMEHALRAVRTEVPFLAHCPAIFLSALSGRNVEKIFPILRKAYLDRFQRIGTGVLNKFIEKCIQKYHPPMLGGKRLRIYYMTQVQVGPPKFVFFVNKPHLMAEGYKRYLINQFR